MDSMPPLAAQALAITAQDWTSLGLGDDPNVAATDDFETNVERLTAVLLVRVVAVISPEGRFQDLSTTCICRKSLLQNEPWPEPINEDVIDQLREYVRNILQTYNDTPYHSSEHCYHVTISINKLLDLILNTEIQGQRLHPTFGLRADPMMHLVLVFSALIHDAEHRGVPNRQLATEDDPLAILYNDQSIAENRSLFLGFSELLKPKYKELRDAMFPSKEEYQRFRKAVLDLVLTTDIASPERTQIGKSKWKEAFGEEFATVERKVRNEIKRKQSMGTGGTSPAAGRNRRSSANSMCSMYSEITTDIPENFAFGDDEESPSVTPDSSFNGEDYSDDELDTSQDGVIVSSKPFSNVVASSQLHTLSYEKPPALQPTESLGYEPDTLSQNKGEDLGYGDTGLPKHSTGGASMNNTGHSLGYGTTSLNNTAHSTNNKTGPDEGDGIAQLRSFEKAKTPSTQNRNLSMSDFRRSSVSSSTGAPHTQKQISRFQRRFSTSVVQGATTKKYKYRLGIMRAVDLSGEAIETYSRSSGTGAFSVSPSTKAPSTIVGDHVDELDELKVNVIMEQMMTAADVAHNLQGWEQMVKWSNRLFLELKKAQKEGRGGDPKNNWFENQIGFLESYLLPLARRLEDTGVFGEVIGPVFARIVEANRDRWMTDGLGVASNIILEGGRQFPVEGDIVS